MTRVNTSRPKSSVPKRCCPSGGRRRSAGITASGLYEVRMGAKIASKITTSKMTEPIQMLAVRRRRPRTRRRGERARRSCTTDSVIFDAWVNDDINQVNGYIDDDVGQ